MFKNVFRQRKQKKEEKNIKRIEANNERYKLLKSLNVDEYLSTNPQNLEEFKQLIRLNRIGAEWTHCKIKPNNTVEYVNYVNQDIMGNIQTTYKKLLTDEAAWVANQKQNTPSDQEILPAFKKLSLEDKQVRSTQQNLGKVVERMNTVSGAKIVEKRLAKIKPTKTVEYGGYVKQEPTAPTEPSFNQLQNDLEIMRQKQAILPKQVKLLDFQTYFDKLNLEELPNVEKPVERMNTVKIDEERYTPITEMLNMCFGWSCNEKDYDHVDPRELGSSMCCKKPIQQCKFFKENKEALMIELHFVGACKATEANQRIGRLVYKFKNVAPQYQQIYYHLASFFSKRADKTKQNEAFVSELFDVLAEFKRELVNLRGRGIIITRGALRGALVSIVADDPMLLGQMRDVLCFGCDVV